MNRTTVAAAFAGIAALLSSSIARAEVSAEASLDGSAGPRTTDAAPGRDRPIEAAEKSDDDDEAFRIGALAGIGFPRPLALEGMIKVGGVLALGVEYSLMPKTTIAGVETNFWAIAGDARVFPFKGGFFIGLRGGRQSLTGKATASIAGLGTVTESGAAETWFINPRIGFLYTMRSGFTIGIDAGVQIPIGPTLTTTLPTGVPAQVSDTIASVANTFGNEVTPTVDLLRVGFLF